MKTTLKNQTNEILPVINEKIDSYFSASQRDSHLKRAFDSDRVKNFINRYDGKVLFTFRHFAVSPSANPIGVVLELRGDRYNRMFIVVELKDNYIPFEHHTRIVNTGDDLLSIAPTSSTWVWATNTVKNGSFKMVLVPSEKPFKKERMFVFDTKDLLTGFLIVKENKLSIHDF